MPKRRSLSVPGASSGNGSYYFLTYRTFARVPCFGARAIVCLVSSQFLRAASAHRFAILTYCFLPDQVHLLIEALAEKPVPSAFVAQSRWYSSVHFAARTGNRLWDRAMLQRALRDVPEAREASREILESPASAGLVTRARDYPFSGSFAWDRLARLDERLVRRARRSA